MRILQQIMFRLISLGLVALGAGLILYSSHELYTLVAGYFPRNELLREGIATVIIFIGLVGLTPAPRRRLPKVITHRDHDGSITTRIGPVARAIAKLISKRPEVKRIRLDLTPTDDGRRVWIDADVVLLKYSSASNQELRVRLRDAIRQEGIHFLDAETVAGVNLVISDIRIKDKRRRIEEAPVAIREPLPEKKEAPFVEPEALEKEDARVSDARENNEPEEAILIAEDTEKEGEDQSVLASLSSEEEAEKEETH